MANTNKSKGSADTMINVIIAVILIAVIGLAVYAIYGKMSAKLTKQAIENGEKEATVEYLAEQQGMSIEDYLAQYELTISDVSKKSTEEEMTDKMTVKNYVSYASTTIDELKEQYHLDEAPAEDANWGDLRKSFTVKNMVGDEESFKQFKEIYKLDDSITMDTLWTDAEPILEESVKKLQEEAANATPAPSAEAEEAASDEAAEENAEATEAPAEDDAKTE